MSRRVTILHVPAYLRALDRPAQLLRPPIAIDRLPTVLQHTRQLLRLDIALAPLLLLDVARTGRCLLRLGRPITLISLIIETMYN